MISRFQLLSRCAVAVLAAIALTAKVLYGGGVPVGTEFQVAGFTTLNGTIPEVAVSPGGQFVIVWEAPVSPAGPDFDVRGRRFASDGTALGTEFVVNTYTTDIQRFVGIGASGNGDFVVTWTREDAPNNSYDVFGQRFGSDGALRGTEFRVNPTTADTDYRSAIAVASDGDFVVTWDKYVFPAETDVYAQRYASDGTLLGAAIRVNSQTFGRQNRSSVAAAANGDFVVAWEDEYQDGDSQGIFAQRFASDGTPRGGEFQVNLNSTDDQIWPSVAIAADGDFVIAWQTDLVDGDGVGIRARRYASDGTSLGLFTVNTHTTDDQTGPSVAAGPSGDFVVTWMSLAQEGSLFPFFRGVFAQCYGSDGAPLGSEFQVNTYATEDQTFPAIGVAPTGDFVVTWWSPSQPYGVIAQRYAAVPRCSPAPLSCDPPGKSTFKIKVNSDDTTKNKLVWKWLKGTVADQSEFGDPTESTSYALCVYDDGILDLEYPIGPAGVCNGNPCWKETKNSTGYKYSYGSGNDHGIKLVLLKSGVGKAKIVVKGKGANLPVPTTNPLFDQNVEVIVQVQSNGPKCWQAGFATSAIVNTGTEFKDKFP